MDWLCWVFGALVLITLVGHGIWAAIATIFRSLKPASPAKQVATGAKSDLLATEIQLAQLMDAGLIDMATYSRVLTAIAVVRRRERSTSTSGPPLAPVDLIPGPLPVLPIESAGGPEIPLAAASTSAPVLPVAKPAHVEKSAPEAVPLAKPAAPPRVPRRPVSEVFAAFLRDSNIRWGELVGGLLIVGCSVALVISFWGQIAAKPFFQFGLFTSVTVATLALGLYAEHRWKLPTTSRGILLTATMLVPLNFLALAALSHGARASVIVTAGEVAALALFGFLFWQAARVLAPYWPHLLTAGVVLLSGSLLIIQQFPGAHAASTSLALGMLPVCFFGGTIIAMLRRARRWKQIRPHGAEAIFLMLGVLAFATALSLALLVFPSPNPFRTAHELSSLLSLAVAPALATGLLLWQRITSRRTSKYRTSGTAIAIAAAFLMLGCLALAWPDPRTLVPLAALDLIVFTLIALRLDIPIAHAPAMPCLAIVYVLAAELLRRHVGWDSSSDELARVLSQAATGLTLLPLFAILAAAAWLLARMRRMTEASIYAWAAAAISAINIVQTGWNGFGTPGDPHLATWIFLVYAAASLLVARHFRQIIAGWIGCVLLATSFVQFFLTRTSISLPWPTALLAYATVALAGTIIRRHDASNSAPLLLPARWTAMATTLIAAVFLLAGLSFADLTPIAERIAWISVLCFAISAVDISEPPFVLGEISAALATVLIVLARLSVRPWFAASSDPMLDPWTSQAIGAALAAVCLAVAVVRWILPSQWMVARWLGREFAFDRAVSLLLAAGFAAIAVGAFAPGLAIEFSSTIVRTAPETWSVHAAGGGSWLLLMPLLCTFVVGLRGRWMRVAYLALLTLLAMACLLWAARWLNQQAAASAARWALAGLLLIGSIPIWFRRRLPGIFEPIAAESRLQLSVWSAMPVIAASLYTASLILEGTPPIGPDPRCFFGQIGSAVSYLIPLLIVVIVFIVNAVRERSTGWAASASAVCNLAVTLAYTLALAAAHRQVSGEDLIRLIQVNVIAVSVFALLLQALGRFVGPWPSPGLLRAQLRIAILGNALLLVPAALWISVWPESASHMLAVIGGPPGWMALMTAVAALMLVRSSRADRLSPAAITLTVLSAGILAACVVAGRNLSGWADYHVLMASAVVASGVNLAAGAWISRSRRGWAEPVAVTEHGPVIAAPAAPVELQYARHDETGGPKAAAIYVAGQLLQPAVLRWTGIANAIAVLLSIRAMAGDPQRPWWSAGITATIALLWAALACWLAAPRLLYAGGLLLNLATTFWFIVRVAPASAAPLLDLAMVNIAVLSVSGLAALVLHLNVFREGMQPPTRDARLPFHQFAAVVSLMGLIVIVFLTVASDVSRQAFSTSPLMTWGAIGPSLALALAMLWDPDAPYVVAEIYALGFIALSAGLHEADYFHRPIAAASAVAVCGYVLLSGMLYAGRAVLMHVASSLGTPKLRRDETAGWLAPAGIVLVAAGIALAFRCDFTLGQLALRILPATATFAGILGLVFISRGDRRLDLRFVILALLPIAGAAWAWAWMSLGSGEWLVRVVVLLAVLGFWLIVFGWMALGRQENLLWQLAARRTLGPMALAWAVVIAAILCIEISIAFSGESVSLAGWGSAIVMGNLMVAAAVCVLFALIPARDPLKLSIERRGSYVYLAETMLGLGLAHLRLTAPWLFGGALSQYWPLLVMAFAFSGVALAEVFRRRGTIALSSPLFRTGAFLPLLPVIAFWAAPSRVDLSTLLFAVGVFYAVLSATRRSFAFGVLAALAANGGLWSLLARQPSLAFFAHPQVWLIPAAASVLIAAQINRDRLSASQLRFVRYCCLMIVYVSSTADIFLNGVRDHPWLPLVLAGLSVAGVMLGILFRLRAFLFLGTWFLALSVITMIYYASADLHWTWLWYVAGIALGASILVMFALFEKKKAEMLALVDGLKRWE